MLAINSFHKWFSLPFTLFLAPLRRQQHSVLLSWGFLVTPPPSAFAQTIRAQCSEPQQPARCCAASKGNAGSFSVNFTPICQLSLCSEPTSMACSSSEKERRAARRWHHLNNYWFRHKQWQSGWQVLAARSTAWGEIMRGGSWARSKKLKERKLAVNFSLVWWTVFFWSRNGVAGREELHYHKYLKQELTLVFCHDQICNTPRW